MAAAIVLAVLLRLAVVSVKGPVEHDEAIAYLAATGHQSEYSQVVDAGLLLGEGEWVLASEWKRYVTPESGLRFGVISQGLAEHDIHPPLYFWVLHVWTKVFGTGSRSGPMLNIVFAGLGAAVIYGLGRRVLHNETRAGFAALLWAACPAAVDTVFLARQYELLALLTVAFAWALLVVIDDESGRRPGPLALLLVVSAAGLLTHTHFVVPLMGGAVWAAWRLRAERRRLVGVLMALAAGAVLAWTAFPHYLDQIVRVSGKLPAFTSDAFEWRLLRVRQTLAGAVGFTGPVRDFVSVWLKSLGITGGTLSKVIAIVETAVLAVPVWVLVRARRQLAGRVAPVAFLAAWIGAGTLLLFLTFRSPSHAMGYQYLAHIWPLVAIALVAAASGFLSRRRIAACGILVALAALSLIGAGAHRVQGDPSMVLAQADRVVFDNPARGVWLGFVTEISDDTLVYLDDQEGLTGATDEWIPFLEAGDVLAGQTRYSATADGRERLVEVLADRSSCSLEQHTWWERYDAWVVCGNLF